MGMQWAFGGAIKCLGAAGGIRFGPFYLAALSGNLLQQLIMV